MRQGIAPCLGMAEVLVVDDFFLIFGPAIASQLVCEIDSKRYRAHHSVE
ncbi:MAG TPA: hypothetical protein VFA65_24065 [Bryobacteraceae bacterium]|nr:hypothetical protein [Bryobacteraceae bacterium]